jgi:hypothetical protein
MCHDFTILVLDLGCVLANYTTKNTVGLSTSQITSVLDSPDWHNYEKGQTFQQDCYNKACNASSLTVDRSWRGCIIMVLTLLRWGVGGRGVITAMAMNAVQRQNI